MAPRQLTLQKVSDLAGKSLTIVEVGTGWPASVSIKLPDGKTAGVSLHVSGVGSMGRHIPHERRFQNPGNRAPVAANPGELPVLLGLGEVTGRPVFVATDGRSRLGVETRFSVLFNESVMVEAADKGWATYLSTTGERMYSFLPAMLPIYIAMITDGLEYGVGATATSDIQTAALASGLVDEVSEAAAERTRKAVDRLIRDYRFGAQVVGAYEHFCCMCGLDTGLVVGAHILPVAANSPDRIWNGLALCHNHHAAFDLHKIWVHPKTRRVAFVPEVLAQASKQPALKSFVDSTYKSLQAPLLSKHFPREEMFCKRYDYFDGLYQWSKAIS